MKRQNTSNILMIRPVNFFFNEETALNNYYQKVIAGLTPEQAQAQALEEFDNFVIKLRAAGVNVVVIDDTEEPVTPDSIFPNNWVSFHQDGSVGLYPMFAESRRGERREDIIDYLKEDFEVRNIVDFTFYESLGKYLEGTGSMILDRPNQIVYAAISERTEEDILIEFCKKFEYRPVTFVAKQAVNGKRLPIYHTNVMMCVADTFAVICAEAIDDEKERVIVLDTLKKTGKEIILITEDQESQFAGNMLQVEDSKGSKILVMSSAAYHSLSSRQIEMIEKHCPIMHGPLDMIEACGGGSARCMMAEIFLPEKTKTD